MESQVSRSGVARMNTACRVVLAFSVAFLAASQCHAGTLTGGATEWTQIANHVELVESYVKQVEAAKNTLQSASALKQQLQQLDPSTLASLSSGSIGNVQQLARLYSDLDQIQQSGGQSVNVLQTALQQMQQQKITPQQYLAQRAQLAQTQGGIYKQNYEADQKTLQTLQQQVADLQHDAAAAHGITSEVGGLQQVVASGTRVQAQLIQLNASVTKANLLAEQQGAAAAADQQQKAAADQQRLDALSKDAAALNQSKITVPDVSKYTDAKGH